MAGCFYSEVWLWRAHVDTRGVDLCLATHVGLFMQHVDLFMQHVSLFMEHMDLFFENEKWSEIFMMRPEEFFIEYWPELFEIRPGLILWR